MNTQVYDDGPIEDGSHAIRATQPFHLTSFLPEVHHCNIMAKAQADTTCNKKLYADVVNKRHRDVKREYASNMV